MKPLCFLSDLFTIIRGHAMGGALLGCYCQNNLVPAGHVDSTRAAKEGDVGLYSLLRTDPTWLVGLCPEKDSDKWQSS